MIERHVTFEVLSDKTAAFEEFFIQEYRPAMSRMPGFVRVELLRLQDSATQYQMIIRFETVEDAAGWRASPEHQELSPKIKELYHTSQLQVYQVIA
jgi:antibiotic biosynthesis monooxygenase (ABM) superfamily enzyme